MENEELLFRATKDVDIVLIVESITAEFGRQFWEYVKEAGYEHLNKSTGNAQFYHFTSPKSKEYPYMIEIFSRNPGFIILEDDAVLTPLPIDDEISSLSAILLNEAYYELLKTGQMMVDGIPVLSPTCLIPFKAKAWLDLKERKLNGEQVDSKNIKKHKNDVFRLAQLITANTRQVLSSEIAEDMKKFLSEIADETVDLKSLGIRRTDKQKIIDMLYLCYNLNEAAPAASVQTASVSAESVQLDLSKVKIEPLFEEYVDFDTFAKSDFRVVKIEACEAVPKSKKLLKFTLNDGTDKKRTILSGIHVYYEPEQLVGKTAIAIVNLPPRKMMGIDSEGVLISAVHEEDGHEGLNLLMLDNAIPAGAKLY